MKKSAFVRVLTAIALSVSACATVKGVGKDIQSVGQAGEEAIN